MEAYIHPFAPAPAPARQLRACFLRGGTSKGVFLLRSDLPADRTEWAPIILRLMGSPDPEYARQLDGMGGGVSSLSKAVIVGPAADGTGAEVEYTFVQVGVRDAVVDYSGNCGNLSSVVGPFALLSGLVRPSVDETYRGPAGESLITVRALNTNTSKLVACTFPVRAGAARAPFWPHEQADQSGVPALEPLLDLPQAAVAGVPGLASTLTLDFVNPGGARTGKLLPSGHPIDLVPARELLPDLAPDAQMPDLPISLVDATNPTVLAAAGALASLVDAPLGTSSAADLDYTAPRTLAVLEAVRRAGARRMGLDPAAQAQPKVAVISPADGGADLCVRALSMGVLHRAVPMTVGLCIGVAAHVPGSLAWEVVRASRRTRGVDGQSGTMVRISHPSGTVDVGAEMEEDAELLQVRSAKVVRTGRLLMEGYVYY